MKKENISDALNNIDFDMIEDVYESTKAKKKNKLTPGAVSEEQIRDYKTALISFAAIACVLLAVVIGVISLLDTAVAYM